jgi:PII-like signaling protein
MMLPASGVERVTIYLTQTEHHGQVPDFVKIVEQARRAGLAGATVVQGIEGYGSSSEVHRRHPMEVREDVPVAVTIVDVAERISDFLDVVAPLLGRGRVVRQPTQVVIPRAAYGRDGRGAP